MQSTYRLKANELTTDLINALKSTYHDREIEITIQEVSDETDYLLSSPANKAHLLAALENINSQTNLVSLDPADL